MASSTPTLSSVRFQSLGNNLAHVHAWAILKQACGHSLPFFEDGPPALPLEPCAPVRPVLTGAEEAAYA